MDLSGVSMALPAAILGGVQGQIGAILNKWLDYKYQCKLADDKALQDARDTKGKQFLSTRKILAISTVFYIFLCPYLSAWYGIPIFFPLVETNGIFVSLFSGATSTEMMQATGFVIMPFQIYLASMVWSMYFGGKRV
jgi:hypothetical protein